MTKVANPDTAPNRAVERHLRAFETFERDCGASPWLGLLRRKALARFAKLGFPTKRDEEWKYTDPTDAVGAIDPIRARGLALTKLPAQLPLGHLKGHRLVWVDGHYDESLGTDLSLLPNGVEAACICTALANHSEVLQQHFGRYADSENEAFTALNTAFAADGAFIRVPAGVSIAEPIILLFLSTDNAPAVIHPRNLFLVGPGSGVTVVEAYASVSEKAGWTNAVTEISVGQNANLEHIKIQLENEATFHVGTQHIFAARDAQISSYCLNFGGGLVRNNSSAVLGDENIVVTLNGLVVASGQQHVDNHTVMDHAKPRCQSHELYAHVLDGHATGVFNGKIFVREDAQKTDAKQSNRTLLLSADAQIDAKPQLEIFADDVKCTHGATIGQMDREALFYLRSRGVPLEQARNILVRAFAAQTWDGISAEDIKVELEKQLLARLG